MAFWCVGIRFHGTESVRKTGHAWYVAEGVHHPVAFSGEHICWVRIMPGREGKYSLKWTKRTRETPPERRMFFFRLKYFTRAGILKVKEWKLKRNFHKKR